MRLGKFTKPPSLCREKSPDAVGQGDSRCTNFPSNMTKSDWIE